MTGVMDVPMYSDNQLRAAVAAERATLTALYDWLAIEVAFPFDFTFGDKPPWLDIRQLAEAWQRHDPSEDAETWLCAILDETGWDA